MGLKGTQNTRHIDIHNVTHAETNYLQHRRRPLEMTVGARFPLSLFLLPLTALLPHPAFPPVPPLLTLSPLPSLSSPLLCLSFSPSLVPTPTQ